MPATSAAFAGNAAVSCPVEVIPTVCVDELTTFQFASTALTAVTANDVPAGVRGGCAGSCRVRSPGSRGFAGHQELELAERPRVDRRPTGDVFAVFVPSLMSVAVSVGVPAVFKVTL